MGWVVRCFNRRDEHGVSYTGTHDKDVTTLARARRFRDKRHAEEEGVNCVDCRAMPEAKARDLDLQRRPVRSRNASA